MFKTIQQEIKLLHEIEEIVVTLKRKILNLHLHMYIIISKVLEFDFGSLSTIAYPFRCARETIPVVLAAPWPFLCHSAWPIPISTISFRLIHLCLDMKIFHMILSYFIVRI